MSKSSLLLQDTGADNPWRRLPWVIPISLSIWGALLCGFGILLEHMAQQPEQMVPIDAQIIELQPSNKHAVIPKLAMSTPDCRDLRSFTLHRLSILIHADMIYQTCTQTLHLVKVLGLHV